ncbi:conserved unknown protein [Ectocarpus siliculosus]|uniref:Uncharacterized protein n=1 Tax=Ectocarpus siliculosus TaxID=2880 RepID=D7FPV9_ECTSI|nr:conserved unknown protein [Ectocarpus siliculosus]|eukprot:CBJ48290.1 conserved unknown protein [Ectocarpus siliculosus]
MERGERLRKREAERAEKRAKKRRKLGKKPLTVDRSGGYESQPKKHANKRRLELARLERLVSKQEELLRDYRPPVHVAPLDPELKRKRRRRDFYDLDTSHWKLTGAARPADSLPGAGGTELVNEREDWEAGEDLFEKLAGASSGGASGGGNDTDSDDDSSSDSGDDDGGGEEGRGRQKGETSGGGFYEGPEACREYLDLNHQLAQRLHDGGKESQTEEALKRYQRSLELDPVDHVNARRGLVRLLLDGGDADKARAVIDRFPDDRGCEMAWSLAAIEFVAWSVLQEDGSGEEVAGKALREACGANPFVAWNIAHREVFDEVVEHADEIESPPAGSVMEAFWYMVREGGLWESLEGASEWVADFLLQNEMLPPNPHQGDDGVVAGEDSKDDSDGNTNGGGVREEKRVRQASADEAGDGEEEEGSTKMVLSEGDVDNDESNAGMFANMFETAVGMAAELAEQQLGMEEGEGGEEASAQGRGIVGRGARGR